MSRKKKELLVETRKSVQLRIGPKKEAFASSTWLAVSPSSELTRSEQFWHVRSNVNRDTMLKYMRMRHFWIETSDLEKELSFSHNGFLKDVEFNVLLALLATTELSRFEITSRMEQALLVIGKKSNFRKQVLDSWISHIVIVADLQTRPVRKHKAYSGWVRNASSVGSKKKNSSIPEPISEDMPGDKIDEFNFLYELISVGRYEANSGVISLS